MSRSVTREALNAAIASRIAQGDRVIGPVVVKPGLLLYVPLAEPSQLVLDGFSHPRNAIKEVLFPRHETLFTYRVNAKGVELNDADLPEQNQLIVGARPCDAAALPILDHVFNWDTKDESYNRRRALTTVVTVACHEWDAECFCTSVGLGPQSDKGSDALLLQLDENSFEVRIVTEKGEAFFNNITQHDERQAPEAAGPAKKFDVQNVAEYLQSHFDSAIWEDSTLRCLGCGACAFTCPTCHCFDIVDEGNAVGGCRVKNWDSCQFCLFTAHASGHNPRTQQFQRQRQRVLHKFQVYPEHFGEYLCTGCGNCTRNCPAGLGILNTLDDLSKAATQGLIR